MFLAINSNLNMDTIKVPVLPGVLFYQMYGIVVCFIRAAVMNDLVVEFNVMTICLISS